MRFELLIALVAIVSHTIFPYQAIDVRMYDTHNPGFCYHCTGAIRACDKTPRKNLVDIFDVVRSMLFTDGELDPDKILCLHVLTAHYAKSESSEFSNVRPITPLIGKGESMERRVPRSNIS